MFDFLSGRKAPMKCPSCGHTQTPAVKFSRLLIAFFALFLALRAADWIGVTRIFESEIWSMVLYSLMILSFFWSAHLDRANGQCEKCRAEFEPRVFLCEACGGRFEKKEHPWADAGQVGQLIFFGIGVIAIFVGDAGFIGLAFLLFVIAAGAWGFAAYKQQICPKCGKTDLKSTNKSALEKTSPTRTKKSPTK